MKKRNVDDDLRDLNFGILPDNLIFDGLKPQKTMEEFAFDTFTNSYEMFFRKFPFDKCDYMRPLVDDIIQSRQNQDCLEEMLKLKRTTSPENVNAEHNEIQCADEQPTD
jgi:hypothetical protein